MRLLPIFTLIFAVLFVVPAMSAATLSQKEISSELIGKKLTFSGAFSGKITYRRGGKFIYTTGNSKQLSGTWHFKGNKICTKFDNNFRGGRTSCFSFERTGKRTYVTSLGYQVRR
ncbi:hypothetical protein ABVF61_05500 [Roseibium sp. HPY-6]|uniref:hypothetical protein n=1 Tax=Roseibium sp. HPY-6 TaxID=3229852 RepID=UPI00338DE105